MPNKRLGAIQGRKCMFGRMFHMSCGGAQLVSVNEDRNTHVITAISETDEL